MINKNDKNIYKLLSKYYKDLNWNNSRNKIILKFINENEIHWFSWIFIYYNIIIKEVKYYYLILEFNKTHLKIKYKKILFIIIKIDVNEFLFSFTLIVINIENNENWIWFIQLLHNIIIKFKIIYQNA